MPTPSNKYRVMEKMLFRITPFHFWINLGVHLLLFSAGYLFAIVMLNGLVIDEIVLHTFLRTLGPLLVIRMALFYHHDLFQGLWRYVSFEDLTNIIRASVIGTFLFYVLGMVWGGAAVSEALYLLEFLFCVICCGGVRYLVRNVRNRYFAPRPVSRMKKILLVGPIGATAPILKEFMADSQKRYLPVALIDPEGTRHFASARISDVPVFTIRQAAGKVKQFAGLHSLVICWPDVSRSQLDRVVEELKNFKVPFKRMPSVEAIMSGSVSISDIRTVGIEDLLERPPVETDMQKISEYLKGKTILVTGGGGSIGSEICRQMVPFAPKLLVVAERSENSLYDLQLEFRRSFPQVPFRGLIASVNDAAGMERLMRDHNVEVIFHAAAYKHVPLMEDTPTESAYNNIIGTCNTAMAAMKAGVERFVMISTDKAVNPTNVMGATKRIAEMVVQGLNTAGRTHFMTVRFGNVLGSAGSVIPLFQKQIRQGGPVTVTHADIERFFMTIPEAVQLVLQAGCMGRGGEIFVLDMGKPVKILHLAEKLITLSGKKPYEDIDIAFTGLRPGEKMYEELFNLGEAHMDTEHPRIRAAVSEPVDPDKILAAVEDIRRIVARRDADDLKRKFNDLVPGYHSGEVPCEPVAVLSAQAAAPAAEKVYGLGMIPEPHPNI